MSDDLKKQFDEAVKYIQNSKPGDGPGPNDSEKLCFYKYYKQATKRDCNTPQPWAVQFEARAKWDAWNSVKGMSKEDAMLAYCEKYIEVSNKYNN